MLIKKLFNKESMTNAWNKMPFKSHVVVGLLCFAVGYFAADCFII